VAVIGAATACAAGTPGLGQSPSAAALPPRIPRSPQPLQTLVGHDGPSYEISWSPDGTRVASADYDTVRIRDIATGTALHVLDAGSLWSAPTWSADGTRLTGEAIIDKEGGSILEYTTMVWTWDTSTGEVVHKTSGRRVPSPDDLP
jgi:WD40 repeat protein